MTKSPLAEGAVRSPQQKAPHGAGL
jgi:hypothetical protein